jgi:hypothetical protein
MRTKFLILVLFIPSALSAQVAHPRIWLDSTTMTRLTALKNANDATWVTLKAFADTEKSLTVEAYAATGCTGSDICYAYEGGGWATALIPLALVYKMTGDTSYSNQVKAIMNAMANASPLSGPQSIDSGYPSRYSTTALAIGYDWIYDQLSSSDKTAYAATLDAWWTQLNSNGYQWVLPSFNDCGNYFAGHVRGFGLAAIAFEGDDSNTTTIMNAILSNVGGSGHGVLDTLIPSFDSGCFSGGTGPEGYSYGFQSWDYVFGFFRAMHTAGKDSLLVDPSTGNPIVYQNYVKTFVKGTIYNFRPDLWAATDEGDWAGNYVRVMPTQLPYWFAGILGNVTEGGWAQFMYNSFVSAPTGGGQTPAVYRPDEWNSFFFKDTSVTPVDYTATFPTYYYSQGDYHSFVRSDWTTSAIYTTFNSGSSVLAGHDCYCYGNISIQRGADYLMMNAGQWGGANGAAGNPQADDHHNWHNNTLFLNDSSATGIGHLQCDSSVWGCQQYGVTNGGPTVHKETANYIYSKTNLKNAYISQDGTFPLTTYYRAWINVNSTINFIYDRVTALNTSATRKLVWHTSALTSATPAGLATAISIAGSVASATVGASKLYIDTLTPSSPGITSVTDGQTAINDTTLMPTQHFEITDPNAGSNASTPFLTVLAPLASGASLPTTTLITSSGGTYTGALYSDATTPLVAMFSIDGTSHASITYTSSYGGGLTGRHVITDLTPGNYSVVRDGSTILTGQTVGSDGSLSFTATGSSPGVFALTQTQNAIPAAPTKLGVMMVAAQEKH